MRTWIDTKRGQVELNTNPWLRPETFLAIAKIIEAGELNTVDLTACPTDEMAMEHAMQLSTFGDGPISLGEIAVFRDCAAPTEGFSLKIVRGDAFDYELAEHRLGFTCPSVVPHGIVELELLPNELSVIVEMLAKFSRKHGLRY